MLLDGLDGIQKELKENFENPRWVGWDSEGTQGELRELGFEAVYTFEKMKPMRHAFLM